MQPTPPPIRYVDALSNSCLRSRDSARIAKDIGKNGSQNPQEDDIAQALSQSTISSDAHNRSLLELRKLSA